jgi:D-glycero-D-manno-heptose 1,7-bisphosphate phosphatase
VRPAEKLLILDRDGVINEDSDAYIKSLDEWQPIPGSIEALGHLRQAGYRLCIATNQSGLARGLFQLQDLEQMHQHLAELLRPWDAKIDHIFFCPHGPEDGCDCRKPKPGLFDQIKAHYGQPLDKVFAIGDSGRDLIAARLAGARPVLVLTGKGRKTLASGQFLDVPVFENLLAFSQSLLSKSLDLQ